MTRLTNYDKLSCKEVIMMIPKRKIIKHTSKILVDESLFHCISSFFAEVDCSIYKYLENKKIMRENNSNRGLPSADENTKEWLSWQEDRAQIKKD